MRAAVLAMLMAGGLAAGCAGQSGRELVVSSDPQLAALAAELLPDLTRRAGLELREPVRVEERSRTELVRYLESKLDEELPPEEAEAVVGAYSRLGLAPPDLDLRAVLMGLYTEQVAGFYEPDSTALFVMDDQAESDLRPLLVHELVHAVQDQSADLDALTDPELGSDRATAAQAAIEGHATLVMFEYMTERQVGSPVDLSALPGVASVLRGTLEAARAQFPALASAPPVLQESLIFPYVEGAIFLQERWAEAGRVAPFGENLPHSTAAILDGAVGRRPVELDLDVEGGRILHEDVLGRLELEVLLEEHFGASSRPLAGGWAGDRYALVEASDGTRALVSYVVWEDAASRNAFAEAIDASPDRFGGEATIERLTVGGWPATRLTVDRAAGVTVRVSGAERR